MALRNIPHFQKSDVLIVLCVSPMSAIKPTLFNVGKKKPAAAVMITKLRGKQFIAVTAPSLMKGSVIVQAHLNKDEICPQVVFCPRPDDKTHPQTSQ